MKLYISDRMLHIPGGRINISVAYTGLVLACEAEHGDLHVCHRDGGIEVWEAKRDGRLLWSSISGVPED